MEQNSQEYIPGFQRVIQLLLGSEPQKEGFDGFKGL